MARRIALCPADEVAEGQARGLAPTERGRDSMFALRHQGELRLYRNLCPHLDVPLEYRKDRFLSADGQRVICYAHGAQFLPDTGECIHGPCRGQSLAAVAFEVRDGWIEVSADAIGRIHGLDWSDGDAPEQAVSQGTANNKNKPETCQ